MYSIRFCTYYFQIEGYGIHQCILKVEIFIGDPKTYLFIFKYMQIENINTYCRHHEKTSYMSNYALFTLLHKWVGRRQTLRLEKLNNTLLAMKSELHT